MGQAQREAIEAPGYVAVPRVATIALQDPLVGPFPKKKSSFVTRLVDVIGALALLVFTAPLIFVLALMSKPMVVTLPAVLLLVDFWPLKRFGDHYFHPQEIDAFGRPVAR